MVDVVEKVSRTHTSSLTIIDVKCPLFSDSNSLNGVVQPRSDYTSSILNLGPVESRGCEDYDTEELSTGGFTNVTNRNNQVSNSSRDVTHIQRKQ